MMLSDGIHFAANESGFSDSSFLISLASAYH
jgi:hypothetical protein